MSKSTVDTIVSKIKRRSDYNVTGDTDLDALVLDAINDGLKMIKQSLYDYGLYEDISKQVTFKTDYNQAYTDIQQAKIVGNTTTFTAVAADAITVKIDAAAPVAVVLTGAATIADVVTKINTALAATVASANGLGVLVITSPTSGSGSIVTVAQTAGTPLARLFNSSTDWTQSGITDLDEILMMSERTYKFALLGMSYQDFIAMYPDPDSIRAVVPDIYCRWNNKIYFGPTPNANSLLYMDYIFEITEVASGGTLPFQDRYDPLLIAFAKAELMEWLDAQNSVGIAAAKTKVKEMKNDLIVLASRNVKLNRQTSSRRNMIPYFSPRKKIVA
jgi:hypothetical protein